MSKVAVVYWSGTGNTEAMAKLVAQGIEEAGGAANVFQCSDFNASKAAEFDAFALGCPAMGDEVLEETEFEPMYESIEGTLNGAKVALFGSYGWGSGEWMDDWEDRAQTAGIDVVDTLIANEYPDAEAESACKALGAALV